MLSKNRIAFQSLLAKMRYKHEALRKDEPAKAKELSAQLDKVIWHSARIVYPDYETDCRQISKARNNRHQKKKRANKELRFMFQSYDELSFVTLTWSPESLEKLSENVRRKYVRQWLEQNCRYYVGNVDYGRKNQREHYHAVVALNRDGFESWKYGFSKVKELKVPEDKEPGKISGYMIKLVNHAGKAESGRLMIKRKGMVEVDELPF